MNRLQKLAGITVLSLAATATATFAQSSTPIQTGVLHGQVHSTSGRASIYEGSDGKLTLRLTKFKTSNGRTLAVDQPSARPSPSAARSMLLKLKHLESTLFVFF